MKQFACGDVVPGCEARFIGGTDEEILAQVARHAAAAHGFEDVPAEVVSAVQAAIRPAA
jgi:predicted small metal-binding protein